MIFRPKNANELSKLDDEELFAYLVASRDAGDGRAMSEAVYALVQARRPMVVGLVARSVPSHERDDLVHNIFSEACLSLSESFAGEHIGEFVNFLRTIAKRRIADFTDKQSRQLQTDSLEPDNDDEQGIEPAGTDADPEATVSIVDARDRVLETRSEEHQKVIIMRIAGVPSKEVIESIEGQTVANVDKILSRFRKDLRKELGY